MGKGGQGCVADEQPLKTYGWEEIKKHSVRGDRWLVIEGEVYDITKWSLRHPGGSRVIGHYAGQDGTEAFTAFHNDLGEVRKYMKTLHIGSLEGTAENKHLEMQADMEKLRQTATKMGLFSPSICFFILNMAHILLLDVLAYLTMVYFGTGWVPYLVAVAMYTTVQAQAAWTQHDFGHLSVCGTSTWNHILHTYLMNFIKGASSSWWNHLHFQHHAKPNVMNKDPDVRLDALFVLGEKMPKQIAKAKKYSMPYNWQHRYFFAIGPPLLFPLYFQYMIFKHSITRRNWKDFCVMLCFYVRLYYMYGPMLGLWGVIKYYFIVRCLESHWFVWVAQSNHIPMEIDEDKERPWFTLQLHATCNVVKNPFNDWFTGHLNHQIEHHLFPTMPRHNLYKMSTLVKSMCAKYGVPYEVKPLLTAFGDIVRSLKSSGEIWHHYYQAYQMA